jgi:hypothetical protein
MKERSGNTAAPAAGLTERLCPGLMRCIESNPDMSY